VRTERFIDRAIVVAVLLCLGLALPVAAEDVEKRFRIGVNVGYMNPADEITSDAANQLLISPRSTSSSSCTSIRGTIRRSSARSRSSRIR